MIAKHNERDETESSENIYEDLLNNKGYCSFFSLERKPAELSGGQRQRVALARTIVSEQPVCLMDEPLSNLDAKLRAEMRSEITALQKSLGLTMVYVTHDQVEAMSMADQIILIRKSFGKPKFSNAAFKLDKNGVINQSGFRYRDSNFFG